MGSPMFPAVYNCPVLDHVLGNSSGDVGFEVFLAVTMKNAVFWDVKNPFRT
jgi:hypothetical protein